MGNKGSTFAEVLLSLFILSLVVVLFNQFYYHIQKLNLIEESNLEMMKICKNKIEELKTERIYVDEKEYFISEFTGEVINFKENDYDVNISIKPLLDNTSNYYINVDVSKDKGKYQYNIVRYFNFEKINFPVIYEELEVEPI